MGTTDDERREEHVQILKLAGLYRGLAAAFEKMSGWGVVVLSARLIAPRLEGDAQARVRQGGRWNLIAYLTGAVVYLLIGLLNPLGLVILLESALPSSLGGSSGLLWMTKWLDRRKPATGHALSIDRSPGWILAACAVTIGYALILGPTRRP